MLGLGLSLSRARKPLATGPDVTAPTLTWARISLDGESISFRFSEPIVIGSGGAEGLALSLSGGAVTATYTGGAGTRVLTCSLSRTVAADETGTIDYTQPGDGIEDASGNDLASIADFAITHEPDTEAPTAPTDFAASDVTHNSITLGWTAATDNVGVDHYELSQDGVVVADDIAGNATSYEVTGLDAETAYGPFSLVAVDAADNTSTAATLEDVTTEAEPELEEWENTFTGAAGTTLEDYAVGDEITWTKNSNYSGGSLVLSDANRLRAGAAGQNCVYYADNITFPQRNCDAILTLRVLTVPTTNGSVLKFGICHDPTQAFVNGVFAGLNYSGGWSFHITSNLSARGTAQAVTLAADTTYELKVSFRDHVIRFYWDGAMAREFVESDLSNYVSAIARAALWINMPSADNTSGIHIESLQIVEAGASYSGGVQTVAPAELWDNGYDGTGNPKQSPFARWKFETDANVLKVTGETTIYDLFSSYAELGLFVDGAWQAPGLAFQANETRTFTKLLPSGTKTIEIVAGLTSRPVATVLGTFINSIELINFFDEAPSYALTAPSTTDRIVVYGDSISVGSSSADAQKDAWTTQLRITHGRNVLVEGYGYRALNDDCADASARTAFANRIASYSPSLIWLAIGTNDFGLGRWSAADFGTAYADILDKLHVALPSVTIYCQSPLQRISPDSENANGFGDTLGDYRTEISNAATARNSYCTYVEGAAGAIVSDANLSADGLHPSTAGHAEYATAVDALLP